MTLTEVELLTGRSHQIRAQMAYIGHPVIGDPKYGDPELNKTFKKEFDLEWQYLIAYKLQFNDIQDPQFSYLSGKTFIINPSYNFLSIYTKLFNKKLNLSLLN